MKLIFVVILCFAFSFGAIGQTASNTASGSVNIILPISITSVGGNLDFGEILLMGSSTVYQLLPIQGQHFQITGHPGYSVSITFNQVDMSNAIWVSLNGGTVGSLIFAPVVIDSQNEPIVSGNFYPLINNGSTGVLDVMVGGSISVSANQPHGDYIGTFTITVSY